MAERLNDDAVRISLARLQDGWSGDTTHISRTYSFDTFAAGIEFVRRLASTADERNHHPDIDIRYTKILIDLSTHSENGVTDLDFELAHRADEIAGELQN